ncbi:MAG: HAD family hydrolase [archaeon]
MRSAQGENRKRMKQAIFIDRDSTINEPYLNEELGIVDSPLKPNDFKLLPRAADAIKKINNSDYLAIVITNQPAIAKGRLTEEMLKKIHEKMEKELAEAADAKLDAIYYCPHKHEDECECRKPKPGMIEQACKDLGIDAKQSYMIGDSWADIKAGASASCTTILIGMQGKCDVCKLLEEKNAKPDFMVKDLYESVELILKEE